MKLPKYLTTVTIFSKYLALVLFILFPIIGFYFGRYYQTGIVITTAKISPYIIPPSQKKIIEWKTYKSQIDSLSFEYPSNWKIEIISQNRYAEDLSFTSPNGFVLRYVYSGTQGGPSSCTGESCPKITNYSSSAILVNGWKTLYLVHGSLHVGGGEDYKAVYLSDKEKPNLAVEAGVGVGFDNYILSKNLSSKYIVMEGHYPSGSLLQKLDYKNYFKLEDVEIATRIIQSLSY